MYMCVCVYVHVVCMCSTDWHDWGENNGIGEENKRIVNATEKEKKRIENKQTNKQKEKTTDTTTTKSADLHQQQW